MEKVASLSSLLSHRKKVRHCAEGKPRSPGNSFFEKRELKREGTTTEASYTEKLERNIHGGRGQREKVTKEKTYHQISL